MFDLSHPNEPKVSQKSWWVTFWLCWFGGLGLHRFYAGKIGTGIIWMLTYGCFFVGWFRDLYKICKGEFTDKDGLPIVKKQQ